MSKVLNCLNPTVIVHPLAPERIVKYGNYSLDGVETKVKYDPKLLYNFHSKEVSAFCHESHIDDSFITNKYTGETYPLYIKVRCGKCECCRSSKVNAFVQRCEMETMLYDNKPVFLTLTYDNENKPKDGVNVRDLQLFFKRFRINLERSGYREKIRYVAVGEYGKNTLRPHYHCIVWNLHQTDMVEFRQIKDLIAKSWNNGFVMSRLVDPADNKTFYYTSKYLHKDTCVPSGCNKGFVCSSNRGGGIGSNYIRGLQGHLLRTLDTSPKFRNSFNGQVRDVQVNKYLLDKVFPSFSQRVPSVVKNALRTLNVCYAQCVYDEMPFKYMFDDDFHRFNKFFGQYIYAPVIDSIDYRRLHTEHRSSGRLLHDLIESSMVLERWMQRGVKYYEDSLRLDDKRVLYLSKFFDNTEDLTYEMVQHRAYRYRSSCARARNREVL